MGAFGLVVCLSCRACERCGVPAEDRDRVVQSLLNAWEKEPGDTLADTINAVTHAAHEEGWSVTFRRELERQAFRLVLVYARR